MTRSKNKIQKNFEDDGECDRISRLPTNVIGRIMEFLPMRDAARTCVLSSRWRYVWTNQPSFIIAKEFWNDIRQHKSSSQTSIDFVGIVNRLLLHHIGNVEKFVFEISVISSEQHCDIDLWLSFLSRRGVKVLSLDNNPYNRLGIPDPYRLPSCVFSNPELTNLSISNCIIKMTKETVTGFSRLQSLSLSYLTLDPCVLITPLLTCLSIIQCSGIQCFSISAPELVSLTLDNDDLNLIPYLMCTNIISACIYDGLIINCIQEVENVNFMKLLPCWPKMVQLELSGSTLMSLATGLVPESFSLVLNLTRLKLDWIHLDDLVWVHCILRNSPFLQIFEIKLNWIPGIGTESLDFEGLCFRMEQLHTVKVTRFTGTRSELQFVKFLLRCSPLLKQLLIEVCASPDDIEEKVKMLTELLSFTRASSKAKIIVGKMG